MSLWLALLWFACCALGFVVFILCRKRMADIGHDVGEEIDHRVRRILKAAREAEDQLCDAFLHFQNQADAIQVFQKARGGIDDAPRASPSWNWVDADLGLLRKRAIADETACRCRPPVVASIVGVLALTVGAAVATVILSNSVQPTLAGPAAPANALGSAGSPLPLVPSPVNLPTLPQAAPLPADTTSSPPNVPAQGASNGATCAQGSAPTQPASGQAGGTQAGTSAAAGASSPQANPPTPPQAPAPLDSTGNAPTGPSQDASSGASSAKGVAGVNTATEQSGETP